MSNVTTNQRSYGRSLWENSAPREPVTITGDERIGGYDVSTFIMDDIEVDNTEADETDTSSVNETITFTYPQATASATTNSITVDDAYSVWSGETGTFTTDQLVTDNIAMAGRITTASTTSVVDSRYEELRELRDRISSYESEVVQLKAALDIERKYNSEMREEFDEIKKQLKMLMEV